MVESVVGNLAGLQLKLELVSDQSDEFRIGGLSLKINVGAIIDRPVSAFGIRSWRAVSDRPYKKSLKISNLGRFELQLKLISDQGDEF